jgi:hypothetical protein
MAKHSPGTAGAAREEAPSGDVFDRLRQRVQERVRQFRQGPITPLSSYECEKDLKALFDAAGRESLEHAFQRLEPDDKQQQAPRLRYRQQRYRINKRTPATIATSFGPPGRRRCWPSGWGAGRSITVKLQCGPCSKPSTT